MARFTRIQVASTMVTTGIIPVFFHKDIEICKGVISACYRGGIRVFEFTNRDEYAHEIFGILNKWATVEFPEMILGTGSVIDSATATLYIQLGTNFIVSPILNEAIAPVVNCRKIFWSPGCGTLSEISRAESLGVEIVKIFPGSSVGGPKFVASIKGPMPWTRIMPTGGVDRTEENLNEWFKSGVACVGMGSKLITSEIVENENFDKLEKDVHDTMNIVRRLRQLYPFVL
jgi:2-dehydro-3-deoxyphosphogluconate aldolase/(4S)-4-hydroxy-2-oxoglutarate aldolase